MMRFPELTQENLYKWYILEHLSTLEIGNIVGCSDWTVSIYLKKHNIQLRKASPKYKDLINHIPFGKLTVIKKVDKQSRRGAYWECKCECGNKIIASGASLVKGTIYHCGCDRPGGKNNGAWQGGKYISGSVLCHIKSNAKINGYKFDLTIAQLEELFDKQNGKCALSKIPLTFAVKHKDKNETTASLDRINNYGNYTIDNVQWVHKDINRMKWAYDLNYFISLCREVAKANPGE